MDAKKVTIEHMARLNSGDGWDEAFNTYKGILRHKEDHDLITYKSHINGQEIRNAIKILSPNQIVITLSGGAENIYPMYMGEISDVIIKEKEYELRLKLVCKDVTLSQDAGEIGITVEYDMLTEDMNILTQGYHFFNIYSEEAKEMAEDPNSIE